MISHAALFPRHSHPDDDDNDHDDDDHDGDDDDDHDDDDGDDHDDDGDHLRGTRRPW